MCGALGMRQVSIMACCISAFESCVVWGGGWLRCFSGGRGFLVTLRREFRRSSWCGGGHVAAAAGREPEACGANFADFVLDVLGEAAIEVIRSSMGVPSFHSRRDCPFGCLRALRKEVNVPRPPYACVKRLLVSATVPGIAA